LTPEGFLSGTPLMSLKRFCGQGFFSCFNNPLSTTELLLVRYQLLLMQDLASLETTFHPQNMMAALSQNPERVWGQVVYTVIKSAKRIYFYPVNWMSVMQWWLLQEAIIYTRGSEDFV
jgi:hypothetical protein